MKGYSVSHWSAAPKRNDGRSMNAYRSKPLKFPWPPVLYGHALLSAFLLGEIVGLPVPRMHAAFAWIIGAALTYADPEHLVERHSPGASSAPVIAAIKEGVANLADRACRD